MTKKSPQIEALEKSLGTTLPANAKIDIVIHDLDAESADNVKGGASVTATRTVSLGTVSGVGAVKTIDQSRVGNILANLDGLMCW
jgi:hypothetical protein